MNYHKEFSILMIYHKHLLFIYDIYSLLKKYKMGIQRGEPENRGNKLSYVSMIIILMY